ncbi:hypothetical protein TSOC_007227, partial [Tetrabaena socialis]
MHFFRCDVPADDCGGVVTRVLPGGRPGEAASTQTLVACGNELRPLSGADGLSGLELGPPLQLYADPAAREGEPAAARQPYVPVKLLCPVWDPHTSSIYMRDGYATLRLASDDTVTVVAGAVEEKGDADGPGRTARFGNPGYLVSDGAGSLYVADGRGIRKLQLPPGVGPVAGQVGMQLQAAAGAGPMAALAAAGGPEVLVSTLVPRAPADIVGLAFGGSGNGGRSSSGSLLFMTDAALYRLPLDDPTAAALLLAGEEGAYGAADGRGADARFRSVLGIALDGEGSVYMADWVDDDTTALGRVAADGTVTTIGPSLGGSVGLPAILPNGCLALNDFIEGALNVLGLGLKLPRGHAAATPWPHIVPPTWARCWAGSPTAPPTSPSW